MKKYLFKFFVSLSLPLVKFYWYIFRSKTTGVKCVLRHNSKVLLIRNSYGTKFWTVPGGGVKRNESLETAVTREVKEETGITIMSPKKCGSVFYDGEYKKNTIWVFMADVPSSQFKTNSLEIDEVKWFDMEELPEKKSHLLKQFLELVTKDDLTQT